uniref:Uncharacterized protein n=1 Tax=Anguilla anguilla TaxID=7936 RepID=A0A0E9W206_ANGAN
MKFDFCIILHFGLVNNAQLSSAFFFLFFHLAVELYLHFAFKIMRRAEEAM